MSTTKAPNENYGRELLELHTVGLGDGYTEQDIRNSALTLTGLAVEEESAQYEYKVWRHFVGPVKVLGWSHPNASADDGEAVADAYVTYLAKHPSTARNLATKLAVGFVSNTPSAALVDSLAQVYLDSGTAITPVLRALFAHPEFAAAAGKKVRRRGIDAKQTEMGRVLGGLVSVAKSDEVSTKDAALLTVTRELLAGSGT